MKKSILLIAFSLCLGTLFAQNESGLISMEKNRFYQNDEVLNGPALKTILSSNPASKPDYEIYSKNNIIGSSLMLTGVTIACIGAGVNLASTMKQVNDLNDGNLPQSGSSGLLLAGTGLVLVVAALPFSIKGKKHVRKSVELYNSGLADTNYKPVSFDMILSSNTIGVSMRF